MLHRTYSKSMFTKRVGTTVLAAWGLLAFAGVAPVMAGKPKPPPPPPADPAIVYGVMGGTTGHRTYSLHVCNADGSNDTAVLSLGATMPTSMTWSPDGHSIAFVGNGVWRFDLSVVNGVPLAGNLYQLTTWVGDVDWSPSGGTILLSGAYGNGAMCTVPATGGSQTLLYVTAGTARWSPTGDRIAFIRNDYSTSTGSVNILDVASSAVTTLYVHDSVLAALDWASAGETLAFIDNEWNIYTLDIATGVATATGISAAAYHVSFSPDDSRLIFEGTGSHHYLTTFDLSTGVTQALAPQQVLSPECRRNP